MLQGQLFPTSFSGQRKVEGNGSEQCKVKIKTKVKVDLVVSEQVVMLLIFLVFDYDLLKLLRLLCADVHFDCDIILKNN